MRYKLYSCSVDDLIIDAEVVASRLNSFANSAYCWQVKGVSQIGDDVLFHLEQGDESITYLVKKVDFYTKEQVENDVLSHWQSNMNTLTYIYDKNYPAWAVYYRQV